MSPAMSFPDAFVEWNNSIKVKWDMTNDNIVLDNYNHLILAGQHPCLSEIVPTLTEYLLIKYAMADFFAAFCIYEKQKRRSDMPLRSAG